MMVACGVVTGIRTACVNVLVFNEIGLSQNGSERGDSLLVVTACNNTAVPERAREEACNPGRWDRDLCA